MTWRQRVVQRTEAPKLLFIKPTKTIWKKKKNGRLNNNNIKIITSFLVKLLVFWVFFLSFSDSLLDTKFSKTTLIHTLIWKMFCRGIFLINFKHSFASLNSWNSQTVYNDICSTYFNAKITFLNFPFLAFHFQIF